jgi:ELWxxDGT repeat protein
MDNKLGLFFFFTILTAPLICSTASASSVQVKLCSDVIEYNGEAYFCAEHSEKGREVFRSNGESKGTSILRDIDPGPGNSSPSTFFKLNGFLYFTAENTALGLSLWRTDGTPENTILVKRLINSFGVDVDVDVVARDDERVFLQTRNSLFLTDGTAVGTQKMNANVGRSFGGLSSGVASSYFLDRDSLFFVTINRLYRLRISNNVSSEIFMFPSTGCAFDAALDEVASMPGKLVLRHTTNPCVDRYDNMWISDYTSAGTRMVGSSDVRILASFDEDVLLCSLVDSAYLTLSGDVLASVRAGFDDGSFCENSVVEHEHNGAIYFYQLGSRDLWFKDLSVREPKIIESIPTFEDQSIKRDYANIGNDLYLMTVSIGGNSALFRFDTSEAELIELSTFNEQKLLGLHRIGSQLFMVFSEFVSDPSVGQGRRVDLTLWKFQAGGATTLVKRIKGQGDNSRVPMWNEGGRLYFQARLEGNLWHSNGTSESTYSLRYFVPGREVTPEQRAAAKAMLGIHLLLMDEDEPKQSN